MKKNERKTEMRKLFSLLILIPLSLSAIVHLWNPIGTPEIHADEGHYYRRAINTILGGPPEEVKVLGPNPSYDNPFFGQIFLASMLSLADYPNSLNPDDKINANSVGALFLMPRMAMGILAVIDTFLLFKIAERRYNIYVAITASMLFAVMPFSLEIRRVFLESIQLPFILLSVLFALYYIKPAASINTVTYKRLNVEKTITIFISGIFLGLAIFTKIPAFIMIPLISILIYSNNKSIGLKALGLWIIPVILIPSIWPLYAILSGDFDKWIGGLFFQTNREGVGILSINSLFSVDPVLLVLGLSGAIFALAIKRDYFCMAWIIPFLIFFSVVGLVRLHNYIPLFPAFCLGGGILMTEIYKAFKKYKTSMQRLLIPSFIFGAIVVFGFASAISQLTQDLNSTYFALYSFILGKLPIHNAGDNKANDINKVTVIGSNWVLSSFSWIPNYVYYNDHDFVRLGGHPKIETKKVLFVLDRHTKNLMSNTTEEGKRFLRHQTWLKKLYDSTDTIAKFNFTSKGILSEVTKGQIEIKTNY
jgi:4-amino-4-deoxy-L-arabinose transferase-like glycosyltransferase